MPSAVKCSQKGVLSVAANRRDFLSVKVQVLCQKDTPLRRLRLPAVDTFNPVQKLSAACDFQRLFDCRLL